MARNGSGVYTPPAASYPAVSGTLIESAKFNAVIDDIATALTESIAVNGQTAMTGDLPMGTHKITGLGNGVAATDACTYGQAGSAAIAETYAATSKATPVDADVLPLADSAASFGLKKLTWANIKAALASWLQTQTATAFTTGGTSTAFTLTPSPAITSLVAGQRFRVKFNATAGATPTLAISGLAATALKLYDSAGDKVAASPTSIIANMLTDVEYDGTDMVILDQLPYMTTPAGTIIDFAGPTAPAGYLACPVSATNISRTTYATLFAAIGTTWGAGDGSTTFGIPWFPADYASVQANANVGTSSVGAVIAHAHTYNSPSVAGVLVNGSSPTGGGIADTGSTGGSANLAAGARVLKCVKY